MKLTLFILIAAVSLAMALPHFIDTSKNVDEVCIMGRCEAEQE